MTATRAWMIAALAFAAACGDSGGTLDDGGLGDGGGRRDGGGRDSGGEDARRPPPPPPPGPPGTFPEGNEYSWDGSWTPEVSDFPLDGLLDNEYFDGHDGSPILPPGEWDYRDERDDLANWRNFMASVGGFEMLRDGDGNHFGWTLMPNTPDEVHFSGGAIYFEGSSGTDILDLGPRGEIRSFGRGNLGEGPDVLIFNTSVSLDYRTGSSDRGSLRDNDLVIGGCDENTDGSFDILTTTIHTGPGYDWVFIRDFSRAAIDLGNGASGRTDTLDPADGDDLVVIRGNAHDFRIYGGEGDDVAVWYLDEEVQTTMWLGPNFFGGGGAGDALWDAGTDRLVLVAPTDTDIVPRGSTPEGALMVRISDGSVVLDEPTQGDPFAAYCIQCGTGPGDRKTLILEYHSADGSVFTGHFFVTAFEELQLGVGDGAQVFSIDDVSGALNPMPSAEPFVPPTPPSSFCE